MSDTWLLLVDTANDCSMKLVRLYQVPDINSTTTSCFSCYTPSITKLAVVLTSNELQPYNIYFGNASIGFEVNNCHKLSNKRKL